MADDRGATAVQMSSGHVEYMTRTNGNSGDTVYCCKTRKIEANMAENSLIDFIELILSTAQTGLTFSKDRFDIERFEILRDTAARFLANHAGIETDAVKEWISMDKGYPTPKLDVRAFILNDQSQVLLVKETSDGRWTLPGGWVDIGESASTAAAREVFEETGLVCKPTRLLALFDKHKHPHPPQLPHAYKAFFLCVVEGGSLIRETSETSDAQYFSPYELPELSKHRVVQSQIETLFAHIQSNSRECLFD